MLWSWAWGGGGGLWYWLPFKSRPCRFTRERALAVLWQVKPYLAMFPAAETMALWDMAATRLIPCPSAPRSYTCRHNITLKPQSPPPSLVHAQHTHLQDGLLRTSVQDIPRVINSYLDNRIWNKPQDLKRNVHEVNVLLIIDKFHDIPCYTVP